MRTVFVMAAVLAAAHGSHGFVVPGFAVAGRLDRTAAMPAPSVGDRATAHAVGSAGVAAAAHNARASNHRRARMARMARIPQFSMHAAAPATSIAGLAAFLDASPTPYQMVAAAAEKLRGEGFVELKEDSRWAEEGMLQQGGKYFYTREGTTLVAFTVGGKFEPGNGFKVVGAHTDSPVLKVKPVSKLKGSGYMQLGVECYGGGLWHTWLDRDLSLAGMLVVGTPDGGFERKLVRVSRPLLRVPSLCIHLQTPAEREKLEVNKEMHLRPILARLTQEVNNKPSGDSTKGGLVDRHHPVLLDVVAEAAGCAVEDIRDFDLSLYDTQPGQVWGANQEFYSGARIDNQVHCFTGLEALTSHAAARLDEDTDVSVLVVFDHEEVGSSSTHGAGSPIIKEVVERVNESFGLFGTGARGGGEAYKRFLTTLPFYEYVIRIYVRIYLHRSRSLSFLSLSRARSLSLSLSLSLALSCSLPLCFSASLSLCSLHDHIKRVLARTYTDTHTGPSGRVSC